MLQFVLLTVLQASGCWAASRGNPQPEAHPAPLPPERGFQVEGFLSRSASLPRLPESPSQPPDLPGRIRVHANRFAGPIDPNLSPAPVSTVVSPSETVQVLLISRKLDTTGSVDASLVISGHATSVPILTGSIEPPRSLIQTTSALAVVQSPVSPIQVNMVSSDIFGDPIATGPPPPQITQRKDHPAPRLGVTSTSPIQTNKFYANFFLGSQTCPTLTHPYSLSWAKGRGVAGSWGIAISHIEASQRVYGPIGVSGAASYYLNPVGIQSICLSAAELGTSTTLAMTNPAAFSVLLNVLPSPGLAPAIQFPLVQGQGFVTAIYNGAQPVVQTGVFFKTITRATQAPRPGIEKYKFSMEDGSTWILYALHTKGNPLDLQVVNNGLARAKGAFYGILQLAKDPGNGEALYDGASGVYATGISLSGTA